MPKTFIILKKHEKSNCSGMQIDSYLKNYQQEFSYDTWELIKFIKMRAQRLLAYPIEKVLIQIAKITQMGQLEMLFLANLVERDQWFVQHQLINSYEKKLKIQNWGQQGKDKIFRSVYLYFLVCSLSVKFYLNQKIQHIWEYVSQNCLQEIKIFFEQYAKKRIQQSFKITAKELNSRYKLLKSYKSSKSKLQDYNKLVNYITSDSVHQQTIQRGLSNYMEMGDHLVRQHSFVKDM